MTKKSFDEEFYRNRSINNLIIFAIYSVMGRKEKCTFEELIKECFTLFPKVFSFSKYQKWPDARKLDRPLRSLRKRKLITGNPKTYFSLTKTGKKLAEDIIENSRQRRLGLK